jgi:hypothetical protein
MANPNPNIENLKPFKPGEDERRNTAGRPPGTKDRSTIFRKWLEVGAKIVNLETGEEEDGTIEDKLAVKVIAEALKGDIQAAKEVLDSVYGKAPQSVKLSGDSENPIQFISNYVSQPGNEPLNDE